MEASTSDQARVLPGQRQFPGLHAGFWRRVVAWFIDVLVLFVIARFLVWSVAAWATGPWVVLAGAGDAAVVGQIRLGVQLLGVAVGWLYFIVAGWLYFAVCESSGWRATPGKLALSLQVVDPRGGRIRFGRASGRFFGKFLSALVLGAGFLITGWTTRKQALHDVVAGCCVVRSAGLAAWRSGAAVPPGPAGSAEPPPQVSPAPATGLSGWAIAVILVGILAFAAPPVAGIVAGFAIPVYEGYTTRSEVTRGLEVTHRARALVGEYIGARGVLPQDNRALGLPAPASIEGPYVASVRVVAGKIVVTYGNQANPRIRGGHVVISPSGNAARLHWYCSSPDLHGRDLPTHCRR